MNSINKKKLLAAGASVLLLLVFVILPLMTACAREAPTTPTAGPAKDTLVIGIPELPPSLDQETATHSMMSWMSMSLWDYLILYEMKQSERDPSVRVLNYDNFEMRLAESFEYAPDYKSITFHLRKGCLSPWGNEFTSDDVYWKWLRGSVEGLQSAALFHFGVMDMAGMDNLEIIDDYTVRFNADRPNALLAIDAALISCGYQDTKYCREEGVTEDDPWAQELIQKRLPGHNAYYVTEWTPGVQAVYEVNPNWWGNKVKGEPEIKKIIWKVIPESSSRVIMLRDGTIDVALMLTPREVDSLRGTPGVKIVEEEGLWLVHLVFNNLVQPEFNDKKVRQAINYAIDRDKIIDMAYYGMADPMYCVFPKQRPGALDLAEFPYRYDIDKAKQAMAESNYPDGFDIELEYPTGRLAFETACILIAEDLAEIGINCTLRKTPVGSLATKIVAREAGFAIWSDTPYAPDPNYCLSLYYMESTHTGGPAYCNYTGLINDEIVAMIEEGRTIMDKEERFRYHEEVQRKVLEDAQMGYVVQERYMMAIRDNLAGWNIDIGEVCRFEECYFTE